VSSIFKSIFSRESAGESLNAVNWIPLTSLPQLSEIEELSLSEQIKAVVVFKHSTSCGISAMAKRRFEREWKAEEKETPVYYLDLIRFRNISNQISQQWDVWHESPQVIVLKNKKVIHHASHGAISAEKIQSII